MVACGTSRTAPCTDLRFLRHKGQTTLCVQSAQSRTRSSENAFLRTVLVWLSTCIPYQSNIVSDYAKTQSQTNASEIAHFVRMVCSGLKCWTSPGRSFAGYWWQPRSLRTCQWAAGRVRWFRWMWRCLQMLGGLYCHHLCFPCLSVPGRHGVPSCWKTLFVCAVCGR